MTIGISKKRLQEILSAPGNSANKELTFYLKWLIGTECVELDPWLPIDEITPKDRRVLLFYPKFGKVISGWNHINGMWVQMQGGYILNEQPAHWQELPEDPKE